MVTAAPRTYHHGDLRRALLDATRELLVEGGIQAASLRAVARRAGVTNRAPYHHFDDKCDLLAAVAAEGFQKLQAEMHRRLEDCGKDPREELVQIGLGYLTFAAENPGEFQVMFWHELCDGETFPQREEESNSCFEILLSTIARLTPRPLDEEHQLGMAMMAWATVHGLATLRAQGALDAKSDDHPAPPPSLDEDTCRRIAVALANEARSV